MAQQVDVIIVGAGLSGITAAYHLQTLCPGKTYVVLEARAALGGTWDLFRYPGVRSDSDMFTLGYRWKPWAGDKALADGPSILAYVREAAHENGIDKHIRYGHRVVRAGWSSQQARWTVEAERAEAGAVDAQIERFSGKFLFMCSGYYDYAAGHTPTFPEQAAFAGRVIHPQHWPADYDWTGKRVVVIGSGATAVTLVPALAERAEHVVMLQRSPTYIASIAARDVIAAALRRRLPALLAYQLARWKNIVFGALVFQLARRRPGFMKAVFLKRVRAELGSRFDIDKHFTPRYNVWDQRVCAVPDGDLFEALRSGRASIVSDHIERFTADGIVLRSGEQLRADAIVTATGLELLCLGGVELSVDDEPVEINRTFSYKGCMFTDVPNLAWAFGYTNASWTLKADLTSEYVCRVLQTMDARGVDSCTPRLRDASVAEEPWLDFSSGYVQRSLGLFPKQGSKPPFRMRQNYLLDLLALRYLPIADGALELSRRRSGPVVRAREAVNSNGYSARPRP